jgi:monoamine oxidase
MTSTLVLIIGAGAAGLAAAQRLTKAGMDVMILEARERIGGRIHTLHDSWPVPIEAGPEFIHGASEEFQRLLKSAGATTQELPERHFRVVAGKPQEVDFEAAWSKILAQLEHAPAPDQSFSTFLDVQCRRLSPDERTMAIEYVEGFNAADSRRVSIQWLRDTEAELGAGGEETIRRLTSGYGRIAETLLPQTPAISLRLNSLVRQIQWRRGEVSIATVENGGRSTEYEGQRVIVTLPLSILQAAPDHGGVAFAPEMPEKRAAAQRLIMGAVVKVALWFREPFWAGFGISERGFLHVPNATFMTWWPMGDSLVLTGWSGGPRAEHLSASSDEAILNAALNDLARGLDMDERRARELLVQGRAFNWQTDPFARGAYSYAAVDGADAARELAAPIEETIFFAGEATDDQFPATVAGAIRSGYRAANQVIRTL